MMRCTRGDGPEAVDPGGMSTVLLRRLSTGAARLDFPAELLPEGTSTVAVDYLCSGPN